MLHQVSFGTAQQVEQWLQAGASARATGSDGWAALPLAILRGDEEGTKIAKVLIAKGADINAYDPNGETPIMNAIALNNTEVIEALLARKVDLFLPSKAGVMPAQFAEHYGNAPVNLLITKALKELEEESAYGVSIGRLQKTLQSYIFENCVYAYIQYNQITALYAHQGLQEATDRLERAKKHIEQSAMVLSQQYYFHPNQITKFASTTQESITQELDGLISTRNRRNLGVGTEEDMQNRCTRITKGWNLNYHEPLQLQQKSKGKNHG